MEKSVWADLNICVQTTTLLMAAMAEVIVLNENHRKPAEGYVPIGASVEPAIYTDLVIIA
jgi:hypothetical protein